MFYNWVFGSIGYDLDLFGWIFFFFFGEKFNEAVSHITNTRLWLVKIRTTMNSSKVKIQMFYSKVQALIVYYYLLKHAAYIIVVFF